MNHACIYVQVQSQSHLFFIGICIIFISSIRWTFPLLGAINIIKKNTKRTIVVVAVHFLTNRIYRLFYLLFNLCICWPFSLDLILSFYHIWKICVVRGLYTNIFYIVVILYLLRFLYFYIFLWTENLFFITFRKPILLNIHFFIYLSILV